MVSTYSAAILWHALEIIIPSKMVSALDSRGGKRRKMKAFGEGARWGWRAGGQEERKGVTVVSLGQLLILAVDPLQLCEMRSTAVIILGWGAPWPQVLALGHRQQWRRWWLGNWAPYLKWRRR
jgi:hypothetical protein